MEIQKLIEYTPAIISLLSIFGLGYLLGSHLGFTKAHKKFIKLRDEYIELLKGYKENL